MVFVVLDMVYRIRAGEGAYGGWLLESKWVRYCWRMGLGLDLVL